MNFESALMLYQEAISLCPPEETKDLSIFLNNKGVCFTKIVYTFVNELIIIQDKPKEAKEEFSKAIEVAPDYVKPRYQRLLILKKEEEYE
jgi:tetratricopeptide (TPR) repeat protein